MPTDEMETFSETAMVRLANHINANHTCAVLSSPYSLTLRRDAKLDEWVRLIDALYTESVRSDSVDTMLKFLIGDALDQGETMWSHEAHQVYGPIVSWAMSTVCNIIRTARMIPPDMRRATLSYRFFCDVAGAELDRKDLKVYLDMAEEKCSSGQIGWRVEVLQLINAKKVGDLFEALPRKDQDLWMDWWERSGRPSWRKVKAALESGEPPPESVTLSQFVFKTLEKAIPETKFGDMSYDDVRQAVSDVIGDTISAYKHKLIKDDRE